MKKILLILLMSMFLISFGSATELRYRQNTDIDLKIPCLNNGTYCSGSATCNITIYRDRTLYPNSIPLANNQQMTNSGSYFNYSLNSSQTSIEGIYQITAICIDGDYKGYTIDEYEITNKKLTIDLPEALIYVLLVGGVLGIFLLSLYFTFAVPYSNKINEKGSIIKITKLKYVKLGFIMLSYVLFVWLLNVLIGVSDNFVRLSMFYGFVSFFFLLLNYLALPFSVFIIVLAGYEIVRDTNANKLIKKLGSYKK